jgi:polar amino acid transport system substrate-binding protein
MNRPLLARRHALVATLAGLGGGAWCADAPLLLAGESLPPFTFERERAPAGLHWELCERLMQGLGRPVRWVQMPWRRALLDMEAGQLDGIIGTTRGHLNEREAQMLFANEPLSHVSTHFVSLSSRPFRFDGLFMLRGMRVAVLGGYAHSPDFMAAGYFQRQTASSHRQCLRMLLAGRVDVALVDLAATRYFIHAEQGGERLFVDPHPVGRGQLLLGLSRSARHQELATQFDAALRAFKRGPAYAALLKRYGLQRADVEGLA